MNYKFVSLLIILVANVLISTAQDANFTQFYAAPLYHNPAFAGTVPSYRLSVNYRKQWTNIPNAFENMTAAFEYQLPQFKSAIGLIAEHHKTGELGLQATNFSILYSYGLRISEKWMLHGGLQGTYSLKNGNVQNYIFEDQLISGSPTLEVLPNPSLTTFDMATGLVAYSEKTWFSFALHHLLRPNQSLDGNTDPLPLKISLQGGVRLPLADQVEVAPALLYQQQGAAAQLDIGSNVYLGSFVAGAWYRGLPLRPIAENVINQDAIALMAGIKHRGFYVGVNYDFSISALPNSGDSYEIAVVYYPFEGRRKQKQRFYTSYNQPIRCPIF